MTSTTVPMHAASAGSSAFRRLTLTEFRLYVREKIGPIWGLGFPVILLVVFGSIPSFKQANADFGGRTLLDVYVPVLIAFVTAILSLVAMPMTMTSYREKGVLRRLSTTPVGPVRVLAAQLVINLTSFVVVSALLLVVARLAYGVRLPDQLGGFVVTIVLTAAALSAIGLLIAAVAPGGRGAQAIGTILFFPMMFFAGLWVPIAQMPAVLRHISHGTPLGAAVQALNDSTTGHWPSWNLLVTLAAYAVVCGVAAARLFRWE